MSFIQKLRVTLSVLLLTIACVISVSAQPQAGADTPTEKVAKTTPPLKTSDDTLEVNKGANKSNDVAVASTSTGTTTASSESPVPQAVDPDKWQFQFSPYFWLAGLHGTGGVGNRTTQVDESFSDVFDALNFAFMGTFEARKGKFISLTDIEYVSVSDEKATPGPFFSTVDAGFKTFIFDQEVGYRFLDNSEGATLDVLGGARVWRVKTDFEFGAGILPATRIEASRSWVDAVGGLRGKMALSEKLFLTGKFDLGGGGSKFTWQVFGGGGYNINPKIALIFGYRVLDVNYDKNNFVFDMNQRGPIVGMGFRF
jgi:hypothetical protein